MGVVLGLGGRFAGLREKCGDFVAKFEYFVLRGDEYSCDPLIGCACPERLSIPTESQSEPVYQGW